MRRKNTILVVPPNGAPLRRLELTNPQLAGLLVALVGLAALAVFTTWTLFTTGVTGAELARLEQENESLRAANLRFEEGLGMLEGRLADYEERTEKLAIVAGLDFEPGGGEPGIGGDDLPAAREDEWLAGLDGRSAAIGSRLDAIEIELGRRASRLASTPSIAPATGLLTSSFGYRTDPLSGERSYHRGIDIGTGPDQPVRAVADGVVVQAGRKGALGTSVHLSHGFGYSTRYGHLSRLTVAPGQTVRQGDVLGYVGTSGRSTGYHLHYEVRLDGKPVNPLAYVLDSLDAS